jgi:acyl-coenzyme A synthetase/AMP-(fatty) acid ligase
VTPADRATQLASPAFDASVWEIWPYLANGASVHIPDDDTRVSPALLWQWMTQKKISITFMPTPLAEAAMSEPCPPGLALRILLTGGDKLKRRPPADFPCPLVNHYGPTESAVVATCAAIEANVPAEAVLPIGKPIANTTLYVLDCHLRRAPIGVPGELCIGGESLARGYLRQPELTAEKFIAHPFEDRSGPRLYRTGDLVRWTATGELEFLGRIDGQVKIRGCRIELGEIEAALQLHPAVRECLVQPRADERGDLQLVAYILNASHAPCVSAVKIVDFLRAKLPAYMIPSAIGLLDAWPLTPNGKIDRAALPRAAACSIEAARPSAAPRNEMEETISRVWTDVLGHGAVGREDNFFDLGGHSLLAARVVTRLSALFPGAVSVRALFDQPTLAAFAREVEHKLGKSASSRGPGRRPQRRVARTDLELVPPN